MYLIQMEFLILIILLYVYTISIEMFLRMKSIKMLIVTVKPLYSDILETEKPEK